MEEDVCFFGFLFGCSFTLINRMFLIANKYFSTQRNRKCKVVCIYKYFLKKTQKVIEFRKWREINLKSKSNVRSQGTIALTNLKGPLFNVYSVITCRVNLSYQMYMKMIENLILLRVKTKIEILNGIKGK